MESKLAVAYMRCSGDGQIKGDTWDRQWEAIFGYASSKSIHIATSFRDEGVTGKMELEGRSGLSACIDYVQKNNIDTVLVESSDRLARDMIVAEIIVREFQKIGVRVIAASAGIDLTEGSDSNPTAKLIRQILAAIAEFDRCVTVLKLRGARERVKAARGKCEGRHAFGDKPEEKEALRRIIAMHESDYSSTLIAEVLNGQGDDVKTRSGKPWNRSTVAKIVKRQKSQSSPALETVKTSGNSL